MRSGTVRLLVALCALARPALAQPLEGPAGHHRLVHLATAAVFGPARGLSNTVRHGSLASCRWSDVSGLDRATDFVAHYVRTSSIDVASLANGLVVRGLMRREITLVPSVNGLAVAGTF